MTLAATTPIWRWFTPGRGGSVASVGARRQGSSQKSPQVQSLDEGGSIGASIAGRLTVNSTASSVSGFLNLSTSSRAGADVTNPLSGRVAVWGVAVRGKSNPPLPVVPSATSGPPIHSSSTTKPRRLLCSPSKQLTAQAPSVDKSQLTGLAETSSNGRAAGRTSAVTRLSHGLPEPQRSRCMTTRWLPGLSGARTMAWSPKALSTKVASVSTPSTKMRASDRKTSNGSPGKSSRIRRQRPPGAASRRSAATGRLNSV
jgi:hypothetical protein